MNIKEAKEEIQRAITSYLEKDEFGDYVVSRVRQRPVLLIGDPGIGKTAIMEQIAEELGIGLVSYSMTHHTRQSAIGLPKIETKSYGGREYMVSEYTMSEIIASVYDCMEATGLTEGILFLDEINCVSETLAPAMLQFLQYKTFGKHEVPEGWIIVAAGNPPEYNRSVREFDLVTLDRVKKIDVTPDFAVWKEYAYTAGVHPAVISYLNIRRQYFYLMETTVDGKLFATPRGWEDLSRLLTVYEKLGKEMDWEVVGQYIQHPKAAKDFANYLELYRKYQTDYQIEAVLEGTIEPILQKKAAHASFDEKLSVTGLLLLRLFQDFKEYFRKEKTISMVYEALKEFRQSGEHREKLQRILMRLQMQREEQKRARLLTQEEEQCMIDAESILEQCVAQMQVQDGTPQQEFEQALAIFQKEKTNLQKYFDRASTHLEHVMDFMESVFGEGQEMVSFITELNGNYYSIQFLERYDCEQAYCIRR